MRRAWALPLLLAAMLLAGLGLALRLALAGFFGSVLGWLCMGAAALLAITWVAIAGLSAIHRRCSRRTFALALACALLLPPLALAAGVHLKLRSAYLAVEPWQLDVHDIAYRKERRWGLPLLALPGDNETGIRVFHLPPRAAQALRQHGIAYLRGLPDMPLHLDDPRTRGRYEHWHETPLDENARRHVTHHCEDGDGGFCIAVDARVWDAVQHAISTPGSYYAIGRSGVIVIDPARQRVIYMYNG